jgi:hypothetical protein
MISSNVRLGFAAVVGSLVGVGAFAQAPPPAKVRNLDPNEVICEKVPILGSRIQAKRVCMTRLQWADQRSQDRQDVEHKQVERGAKGY